jgi:hypothetical protein
MPPRPGLKFNFTTGGFGVGFQAENISLIYAMEPDILLRHIRKYFEDLNNENSIVGNLKVKNER